MDVQKCKTPCDESFLFFYQPQELKSFAKFEKRFTDKPQTIPHKFIACVFSALRESFFKFRKTFLFSVVAKKIFAIR